MTYSASTPAEDELHRYVEMVASFHKEHLADQSRLAYPGVEVLVANFGEMFRIPPDHEGMMRVLGVPKGERKLCFEQAAEVALFDDRFLYVEGMAFGSILPVHHAWVIEKVTREVVDPTWWDDLGTAYYGVEFPTDYLRQTVLRTEVWGIMHHMNPEVFEGPPWK